MGTTLYRSTRGLLLTFLFLFLALPVFAQTGQDALRFTQRAPAAGARMIGMGGANLVGLADYSALFSNPAGLGYFKKSMFTGSLHTIQTNDDGIYNVSGYSSSLGQDMRTTGLGSLAYIHRAPTVRGSMVFGIALNQTTAYDRGLRFSGMNGANSITDYFMPVTGEFTITPKTGGGYNVSIDRDLSFIGYETYAIDFDQALYESGEAVPFVPAVTRGTVSQEGRVTEEGSMNEISFGGALEAARNVMVGLSANISYGKYDFTRRFSEDDVNNENDGVFPGTTDFKFLDFTESFESSLIGVNLRAGMSGQMAGGLRFGLALETPSYYTVNDDYRTVLETTFDNGESYSYGRQADQDVGSGSFEYQITTPWRLGAGLAFSTGNLVVTGDAEFVDWTQLRLTASSDENYFDVVNEDIRDNFQAVVNTRMGLEYWLGNLALRAGAALQPDPIQAQGTRADGTDLERQHTFLSAGIGYRFADQFEVDFGWMQERFQDQYLPYADVSGSPIIDEDVVRDRFSIGIRAYF